MPYIQTQGPTTILTASQKSSSNAATTGSTQYAGDWYQIHPKMGRLAFQVIQTSASLGCSMSSTVFIQVSNDGVNPNNTVPLTIAQVSTAGLAVVADGSAFASSHAGQWGYIRAYLNGASTATAGSSGVGIVQVIVNAGYVGY
jgi:hypothetical protein